MKQEGERLKAEIEELLQRAQAVDEAEDSQYGEDKRGDELPRELAFRESRLEKIREAKAAIEAEAREEAEQAWVEGKHHLGLPDCKAQRNFTDPDSRIMIAPGGKHFIQAYNAQAAVDSANQVIVAAELTNRPTDKGQAEPLVAVVKANVGQLPRQVSADAGYFSSDAVSNLIGMGIDVYMPPDKTRHGSVLPSAPRGRVPKGLSIIDRMRRKLRTRRGRKQYALRMETVEPVFGQTKQVRGFRQFLLRGLSKVRSEWQIICTGHNLLKLFQVWRPVLAG
jgi:hypothetical protein